MNLQRILIVDDDPANIAILANILDPNHEIFAVKSGAAALEWTESGNLPDLILLDVRMPEMDGYELCRRLKGNPRTGNIPVIFVTTADEPEDEAVGLSLGAADYITRPFSSAIVRARVRYHLSLARASRESEARYRLLFDNTADGIVILDLAGRFLEANEAFHAATGFSREELSGMCPPDFIREADAQRYAERFAQVVEKGRGIFETHLARKDRTTFPVEVSVRTVMLNGHSALLAVCRDITERRRVEEERDRYRMQLEELLTRRTAELKEKEDALGRLETDFLKRRSFAGLVGRSRAMQAVYGRIEALADVPTTVLVTGESGTGKELVAEALHNTGAHRDKPLIKVACSALPEHLIESELFGHVAGAFTGAVKSRTGRLEQAGGGTLFLDEIGDISPLFQQKLLRVLQERQFERVGETTSIRLNARIVAATHRDLAEMVRKGSFREDLYYRLKVVELQLPSLRARKEDIPLLIDHFLSLLSKELKKNIAGVSRDVTETLMAHSWPGNVRELGHVLEHACVVCTGTILTERDLPRDLSNPSALKEAESPDEVRAILEALRQARWNRTLAARLLGMSRSTFYRRLAQYRLEDAEPGNSPDAL